ncbi:MAG: cyclic lactone autoinducer peptide [Cellulosilyticaceae bacterium]
MALKNILVKMESGVAKAALKVTELNVNTACMFVAHQPKLPKEAKKLRKF